MKKHLTVLSVTLLLGMCLKVKAQDPITLIIKEAVTKVIKAVDLQIQRLQNETIWLQNAQKRVENTMAELKLAEIGDWVEKQRTLYADYFEELATVKNVIRYYHKTRDIVELARAIVGGYEKMGRTLKEDSRLRAEEVDFAGQVLSGILEQSLNQVDDLYLAIESLMTQMTDASRMQIIDGVAERLEQQYLDLKQLSEQCKQLSLARAKEANEIALVKALYGL